MLYGVVAEHLETFLQRTDDERSGLPFFVRRELREFLSCGILSRGFARVHCSACGQDSLVALEWDAYYASWAPTVVARSAAARAVAGSSYM